MSKMSNFQLVFPLFLTILSQSSCQDETTEAPLLETDLPLVLSPGVYFEEESVNLYDSFVPLIYKYNAPYWVSQRELTGLPNCTDDTVQLSPLCPIFHHVMTELRDQFDYAMGLQFLTANKESDPNMNFTCDTIRKHFPVERLTNDKMKGYLDLMRKCKDGKMFESEPISDYSGKISTVYNTMGKKFMDEYASRWTNTGRQRDNGEVNDKLAIASLLYTHYLALVNRWRRGFRECKKGFIPSSLLSSLRLTKGLEILERMLNLDESTNATWKFTIPYKSDDISRYFTFPIADCVYTTDKFYLRILVPVTRVRITPINLVTIRPIPLYSVVDGAPTLCILKDFVKGDKKFNTGVELLPNRVNGTRELGSLAMEVECDNTHFKFCRIPSAQDTLIGGATECARALILYDFAPNDENDEKVQKHCPLHCADLRVERLPLVIRGKDEMATVYLVLNPEAENGLELECTRSVKVAEGEDPETETYSKAIPAVKKGAVGVILSCDCKLTLGANIILPKGNCPKDLVVFNIRTFHSRHEPVEEIVKEEDNTPAPVSEDEAA